MHIHPSEWLNSSAYQKGKTIIEQLRIVNDSAERGVKLVEDYNNSITRDETQKQSLLQVSNLNISKIDCTSKKTKIFLILFQTVKDYRSKYPETTKNALATPLNI